MTDLEYEKLCERLRALHAKLARREKLNAMLGDLEEQRQDLLRWEEALAETWGKEERDVEKLEKGISGFLASLRGGKEERLEKERAEAYAAKLRYDAKVRERTDVEGRMDALRRERDGLRDVEQEYNALLTEKQKVLRQRSGPAGERIAALEEQISGVGAVLQEVDEAAAAGRAVQQVITSAAANLRSAENYGVWDMLGGDFLSTMLKQNAMDDARNDIERIQWHLSRFSAELKDVQMELNIDLPTGGLLGFADLFFDNLFVDWEVQRYIEDAQAQVGRCEGKVESLMRKLEESRQTLEGERARLTAELNQLVAEA